MTCLLSDVTCRSDNGTLQEVDRCITYVSPMPSVAEACYVSCDHECLFTKWSPWNLCVGGCQGHQFRTRRLIGEILLLSRCEAKPSSLTCQNRCNYHYKKFHRYKNKIIVIIHQTIIVTREETNKLSRCMLLLL